MNDADFKYLIEAQATDLALLLSKDFGLSVSEALDTLYNSETYEKLIDRSTGLYFQSALYVYSFLKNEITTGRIA